PDPPAEHRQAGVDHLADRGITEQVWRIAVLAQAGDPETLVRTGCGSRSGCSRHAPLEVTDRGKGAPGLPLRESETWQPHHPEAWGGLLPAGLLRIAP